MRATRKATALLIGWTAFGAGSLGAQCPLYLLERSAAGYSVSGDTLDEGRMRAFQTGAESGPVAVVLPLTPGQSGNVIQSARPQMVSVRCAGGELRGAVHAADGSQRALPAVAAHAFDRYRVRLNVTDGGGDRIAFVIEPGRPAVADSVGPVIDMFGGQVPLGPGDVAVTTEVTIAERPSGAAGVAELTLGGSHLFVSGDIAGGGAGRFLIDLGASRSVVARGILPAGTPVRPMTGTAYGPEGEQPVRGEMGGLGGEVASGQGIASLESLSLGGITFDSPVVHVVDSLPPIGGEPLAGIVGNDLLRRGAATTIVYPDVDRPGLLRVGEVVEPGGAAALEAPFTMVAGLIMLETVIEGRPIHLILDSGARESLLSAPAAAELGLVRGPEATQSFRGLDGTPIDAWPAVLPLVTIGTGSIRDFRVHVADLPVLERMGLSASGGMLGQNLRHHFSAIVLDWEGGRIGFYH